MSREEDYPELGTGEVTYTEGLPIVHFGSPPQGTRQIGEPMATTVDDLYEEAYSRGGVVPKVYESAPEPPAPMPSGGIGDASAVAHPSHYTSHPSGIEVIDITRHESFLRGNIIKYVLRAPHKGREVEDLEKARQYLDWEIERARKEESNARAHQ